MLKLSNIWKAWVSTAIGILIPVLVGVATDVLDGHVDWIKVKAALIPAVALLLTDLLKEVEKSFGVPVDEPVAAPVASPVAAASGPQAAS